MVATETRVSEVVIGTMMIPEMWYSASEALKVPESSGVAPSWAVPSLAFLWHVGATDSVPCLPLSLRTCFLPHCGPSRYEVRMLGYKLMQAMRFAVEEINNRSGLLPGVRLGYEMVDTCYVSNNVQPVLYFLAQEDYFLPIQEDYSHYVPRVVAVIGPENSESTMTVAHFLSLFLLPQVRPLGPGRRGWGGGRGVVVQRAHSPHQSWGGGGSRSRVRTWTLTLGKHPGLLVQSSGSGDRQTWVCIWALSPTHCEDLSRSLF